MTPALRNPAGPSRPACPPPASRPEHQDVVVDPVEETLQVDVHDPSVTFDDGALCVLHRLVRRSPGPKAKTGFGKGRVPLRLQHLQYCLLHKPVNDRRYAELSQPLPHASGSQPVARAGPVRSGESCSRITGQCSLRKPTSSSTLIPSTPGPLCSPGPSARSLQVLSLAHLLHEPRLRLRAFCAAHRHDRFGPSPRSARGFTPASSRRGQYLLAFLPLDRHEMHSILTLQPFGPSPPLAVLCPLLTSAPRSGSHDGLSRPPATRCRPPGVSSAAFRAQPPGLRSAPFGGCGLRGGSPARPSAHAFYPVRVPRLARLLHASFRPHLAVTPLRFATFTSTRLGRGLSPPSAKQCPAHDPSSAPPEAGSSGQRQSGRTTGDGKLRARLPEKTL